MPGNVPIESGRFDAVRRDFEADGLTDHAICRRHGLTHGELWAAARSHKWKTEHRGSALDRAILIGMLLGVLEQQIVKLEQASMSESNEKETSVLGKLVTTLEKLIEIEGRSGRTAGRQEETGEMRDLRNKLAKRIDRLKQG